MEYKGRKVDLEKFIHETAMKYSEKDLDAFIKQCNADRKPATETGKLETLFSSYLKVYGYLCSFDDDYVLNELSHIQVPNRTLSKQPKESL